MISSLIKRMFFFLAVFFNTFGYAQEIPKDSIFLSLDDAWSKAEIYSKALKVQHLKTEIGKENILDAKNKRLPSVDFDASYGKLSNIPVFVNGINNNAEFIHLEDHSTYDASVSAYFNIYAGGSKRTAIKSAEASKAFLEHIEEETSDQLHLEVIQYYVSLQRSYQYENLVKQNIKQNAERVRLIEQLFKNGVVLKSDLLRAKLQLAKLQTQLVTIENDLVIVTQSLNILLGNEDDTLLIPSDTIQTKDIAIDKNYDSFVSETLSQSPLEKMAEKQITLSELKTDALKADKLPKIGFFGSYTYSYPQIQLYPYEQAPYLLGIAGIKLSYDISALYHDKHKEKAAEIEVEQQKIAKEHVDDNLRKQVKTAYSRFKEDVIKIEVAEENIQSAQENYRIVKQTYFNQLSLLTDLIDADTQQLEAHFELINNQIAAKVHYYQLLKISGKL
ncbi:TolC family protein [Formosa sp. L2A11]|uniref:TolC family protein n=1 Tax=Formosa sp. L2A11 TaxID=2686363 RepID=UPI001E529DFF|nr:TolC family protein [Formosa sp. L2A11]